MYLDAANRKIREPIDYLIKAAKYSRSLCFRLALSNEPELLAVANFLNGKIIGALESKPPEEWETAKHSDYRETDLQPQYRISESDITALVGALDLPDETKKSAHEYAALKAPTLLLSFPRCLTVTKFICPEVKQ